MKRGVTLLVVCCLALAALTARVPVAPAAGSAEVTASKTWRFSGRGAQRIGTIKLRRTARLSWRQGRGTLRITGTRGFRLLETRSRRGSITVRRGTYRRLAVSAPGNWRITIRERR
jgi:hypothetical protein